MAQRNWWEDDAVLDGPAPAAPTYPGVIPGRPKVAPAPTPLQLEDQEMQRRRLGLAEEANARAEDAAAQGTESERTAGFLAGRIVDAVGRLAGAIQADPRAASPTLGVEATRGVFGDTAANYLTDAERQQVRAAQLDVIDAALTLGTGAAYTPEQLENYREVYFPKLGDDPATVKSKQEALRSIIVNAQVKAGRAAPDIDRALTALDALSQVPEERGIARDPEMRGGLPVGTAIQFDIDAPEGPFDRGQYLQERYGVTSDQEALATGFWNANRGNTNLTVEAARDWYTGKGLAPPADADLERAVQDAKAGKQFGGINTEAAERAYTGQLDEVLEQRGADPESVSGAIGVNAAQGIMMEGLDELGGIGGFLGAAVRGQNPVAGYQAERDVLRREVQRARHARPIVSGISTIGGSILTGGAGFRGVNTVRQAAKVGALTGAAVGFNAGEGVVNSALGAGVGAGGGALFAAGTQAVAPHVMGALRRVLPERVPAPTAEQAALIEAGERMSVPMRQPDVRPELRGQRSSLRTTEKGGQIIKDAEAEDVAAFTTAIDRELGGSANPPASRGAMGDTLQDALDSVRSSSRQRIGTDYDRAHRLAGDVRIAPANALRTIDEQIADLEAAGANSNKGLISYLTDLKADLSGEGGMTVAALRSQRTNMRGQINERNLTHTDAERRVGMVLDSAADDIATGLAGKPRALEMFRRADQAWRTRSQFIKQIMEKVTGPENNRKSGSAAVATLEGWVKGDFKRFRRLWSELDAGERETIQASFAENLGRNNRGDFTLDTFIGNVAGRRAVLSDESARLIFGDRGARALKDLEAIARAKSGAASETNRSFTGNTVQSVGRGLRTLMLAQLGYAMGDVSGAVVAPAAGSFLSRLGERRAARLLTNPDFTGWLRRLPDTANPAQINTQFARLDSIAARSPGMAVDVEALKQALVGAVNDNPPVLRSAAEDENANEGNRNAQ